MLVACKTLTIFNKLLWHGMCINALHRKGWLFGMNGWCQTAKMKPIKPFNLVVKETNSVGRKLQPISAAKNLGPPSDAFSIRCCRWFSGYTFMDAFFLLTSSHPHPSFLSKLFLLTAAHIQLNASLILCCLLLPVDRNKIYNGFK